MSPVFADPLFADPLVQQAGYNPNVIRTLKYGASKEDRINSAMELFNSITERTPQPMADARIKLILDTADLRSELMPKMAESTNIYALRALVRNAGEYSDFVKVDFGRIAVFGTNTATYFMAFSQFLTDPKADPKARELAAAIVYEAYSHAYKSELEQLVREYLPEAGMNKAIEFAMACAELAKVIKTALYDIMKEQDADMKEGRIKGLHAFAEKVGKEEYQVALLMLTKEERAQLAKLGVRV